MNSLYTNAKYVKPIEYIRVCVGKRGSIKEDDYRLYFNKISTPRYVTDSIMHFPYGSTVMYIGSGRDECLNILVKNGTISKLYLVDEYVKPNDDTLSIPNITYMNNFDNLPKVDIIVIIHRCHFLDNKKINELKDIIHKHLNPGGRIHIRDHDLSYDTMIISNFEDIDIRKKISIEHLIGWISYIYNKYYPEDTNWCKFIYLRSMTQLAKMLNLNIIKDYHYKEGHILRCYNITCVLG